VILWAIFGHSFRWGCSAWSCVISISSARDGIASSRAYKISVSSCSVKSKSSAVLCWNFTKEVFSGV